MKENMVKKFFIGISAGIVSGLFSTGGGLILVPAFLHILKLDEVKARATSITCILPMVITTSIFYAKNNYLNWKLGILCTIGGIVGSYLGTKILSKISTSFLKISFSIFLFYMGIKMII